MIGSAHPSTKQAPNGGSGNYSPTLKNQAEAALNAPRVDFIAAYHAVTDLRRLAQKHPGVLDGQTISTLKRLLTAKTFETARQGYFLFREAAKVFTDLATVPGNHAVGSAALVTLGNLLRHTGGGAHRGIAEALGSLPVKIDGPRLALGCDPAIPLLSWPKLLERSRLTTVGAPWYIGRSLVIKTGAKSHLLVVKLAKASDTARGMAREIRWMERLSNPDFAVGCRFDIPRPLRTGNRPLFRIGRLPLPPPADLARHPDRLAIAFIAHQDYFVYPNQPGVDADAAKEMLGRNAFLLGRLAARGVIHDAPIPLFHNRTQRLRRDDQGRYQWFRAGRLDQWLDSCAFPNLGLSGLRDFEHLEAFNGNGRILYRHIGSHFFSLLLVAGSHFRCRDTARVGLDEKGRPVDTRDLFDRRLLKAIIRDIFTGYHAGFTGTAPAAETDLPANLDRLTSRMIEEMGVDRYMTELLRRTDQMALTDGQFAAFLGEKGYPQDRIERLTRGAQDMLITSGPHLGDFNRQICLPELIECAAAMAAVCIVGRYLTMTT